MRLSQLINRLKAIHSDIPFDANLANSEFGPFCQFLQSFEHGTPFVVCKFADAEGLTTSEAICVLEQLSNEAPFDPQVTNGRLGDQCDELVKVYHDPPVTILEFGDGVRSDWDESE